MAGKTRFRSLLRGAAVGTALVAVLSIAAPVSATSKSVVKVTSAANAGPGSFREAVEAANGNDRIRRIRFDRGLIVGLTESVVYTGEQNLEIDGKGSALSGAGGDAEANTTWDGGLFVSRSAADLKIRRLDLLDSFNNGLAVFIPAEADDEVKVSLQGVVVSGAQFHGVFVDGQSSSGYNTDDVPHPACTDPHPVDSAASIRVVIKHTDIVHNGVLAETFDDSTLTGCPRDFDGLRVDDGGEGGIHATLSHSHFDGNLADGVELDETGDGGVSARVLHSRFEYNGDSGETVEGLTDLDDGLDIDETGAGDISIRIVRSEINRNMDEGLDLDEADAGSVILQMVRTEAAENQDENVKVTQLQNEAEDEGSIIASFRSVDVSYSIDGDGIKLECFDNGSDENLVGTIFAAVQNSTVIGNDSDDIQLEADAGQLIIRASTVGGTDLSPGIIETIIP